MSWIPEIALAAAIGGTLFAIALPCRRRTCWRCRAAFRMTLFESALGSSLICPACWNVVQRRTWDRLVDEEDEP